jgi:hypothetical protein
MHAHVSCLVHVVFSTKQRRPLLTPAIQASHHKRMTFEEEFVAILKKHGMRCDPSMLE